MRNIFLSDTVNQLHVAILRSVVLVSLLIPICHVGGAFFSRIGESSQIMIGFGLITLMATTFVLAFISALRITVWKTNFKIKPNEILMVKTYKHVPILYLIFIIGYGAITHL